MLVIKFNFTFQAFFNYKAQEVCDRVINNVQLSQPTHPEFLITSSQKGNVDWMKEKLEVLRSFPYLILIAIDSTTWSSNSPWSMTDPSQWSKNHWPKRRLADNPICIGYTNWQWEQPTYQWMSGVASKFAPALADFMACEWCMYE